MMNGAKELALLTIAQMAEADRMAIAAGIPGPVLMENAGAAVADTIIGRWPEQPVLVLCGPGNNGGDGFVIARRLLEADWPVRLALLGSSDRVRGDAAIAAARWTGEVEPMDPAGLSDVLDQAPLVVDALFGAGLSRPLDGAAAAMAEEVLRRRLTCIAVDVPSGVHGDTGAILGTTFQAALTVTFFRAKPGHLLLPGRTAVGELLVADIGIPVSVLEALKPDGFRNGPPLWRDRFPWPALDAHKYSRGHVVVLGGGRMTGAARLAARAAQRVGAGLVTIACPPEAFAIYETALASIMVEAPESVLESISDPRRAAVLAGPGLGTGEATRETVLGLLESRKPCVLDADALSVFRADPGILFDALHDRCLLTPHDGEYLRLFPGIERASRLERARAAAKACGAVVLLKGPDTCIAAPDGRAAINDNAPPWLATAGSGDSLSGLALGLLGQGMDSWYAGAAAAWLHGAAGTAIGPGLIAEDIAGAIPGSLKKLWIAQDANPSCDNEP